MDSAEAAPKVENRSLRSEFSLGESISSQVLRESQVVLLELVIIMSSEYVF